MLTIKLNRFFLLFGIAACIGTTLYAAQFWRAYCNTEKKEIGTWSNQEKVAKIDKEQHIRNHPGHDVTIKEK